MIYLRRPRIEKQTKATEVLVKHYTEVFRNHGANSAGVDWGDKNRHILRLKKMVGCLEPHTLVKEKILDIGCGYGELLKILLKKIKNKPINYIGIDPCLEMIEEARKIYPDHRFYNTSLEKYRPSGNVDHLLCCGIFTKKINVKNNDMYCLMDILFKKAQRWGSKTITLNTMSPFCDIKSHNLYFPKIDDIVSLIRDRWGYKIKEFRFESNYLKYEMLVHVKIEK